MNYLEKLKQISETTPSDWRGQAQWRKDNRDWLRKAGQIAVAVLEAIDANPDINPFILAEKIGVSDEYIGKIIMGHENLSLQTICKLEAALGITLIEVPSFYNEQVLNLEEEIEQVKSDYAQVGTEWNHDFDFIARHFFELGQKTV